MVFNTTTNSLPHYIPKCLIRLLFMVRFCRHRRPLHSCSAAASLSCAYACTCACVRVRVHVYVLAPAYVRARARAVQKKFSNFYFNFWRNLVYFGGRRNGSSAGSRRVIPVAPNNQPN